MTITLSPRQEALVREKIASGHFASPDDVISESLRLLDEQGDPLPSEEMRREIAVALAQQERGDVAELDIEDVDSMARADFTSKAPRR